MTTFEFQDDFGRAMRFMGGMARQLPFATAKAINATAIDFQRFQRNHQRNVFKVTTPSFVDRSVKIKPFARKTSLEAHVSVDPPGGRKRADIIAKFELGGLKQAKDGGSVSVPIHARRTGKKKLRKDQRPKAFNFQRVGRSWRGNKRTFYLPKKGIYQRRGRGRNMADGRDKNISLLYSLKPNVPIPRSLRFIANAKKIVPRVFPGHFSTEFAKAVRSARR